MRSQEILLKRSLRMNQRIKKLSKNRPPHPPPLCITASGNILANGNLCFRLFKLQLKAINKNACYLQQYAYNYACSCQWKLGEIQFSKVTLLQLMEADFRTFFLLVKTNYEIRQNPIFKKITAKSLFLLGETNFLASSNHFFFSISQRLQAVIVFFRSIGKVFFKQNHSFRLMERDFLARRNRFLLFRVLPRNGNRP